MGLASQRQRLANRVVPERGCERLVRAKVGFVVVRGSGHDEEQMNRLAVAAKALPCATWLDGTTEGERAIEELLGLLIDKGVVALNIIPDRNWNIADPAVRRVKVKNLHDVVRLAEELALPLVIGTEMNRFGQKVVDDFDAEPLAPLRKPFLDGAFFVYGHTVFQRALGRGYQSEWARAHLPSRRARNQFYTQIGRAVPPGLRSVTRVRQLDPEMPPAKMLSELGAHLERGRN